MSREEANGMALYDFFCESVSDSDTFFWTCPSPQLVDENEARPRPGADLDRSEYHAHCRHLLRERRQGRFDVVVVREPSEQS